jgi:hypothetical protein
MKRSRNIIILVGAIALSGLLALTSTREPSSLLTNATAKTLTEGSPISSATFISSYRATLPGASNAFADSAMANTQSIIDSNITNHLPTFDLITGGGSSTKSHAVQNCAVLFSDWSIIYGANDSGLQRPFRIQKTGQTASPEYVPLGFFMGIHGVRKIVFTTTAISMMTSAAGEQSIAVCIASLDGSKKYNLPYTGNYDYIQMSSGATATQFTFTMPDAEATDWTPRWLYIAGSFVTHNLATDTGSTKEDDKETYFCDLISFTVYFDTEC